MKRALVVDDSPAARELARVHLEAILEDAELDMEVAVAAGGMEALKIIAEGDVAILVCDLHMPDLQGLEVLRFWLQRAPEGGASVIVTTQVGDDKARALNAGADAFLQKPLNRAHLEEALDEALKGLR